MSAIMLWTMCVAIVIALAVWLSLIALAQRRPSARDAVAVNREDPEESAMPAPPERPGEGSGNPMDL